MADRDAIVAYCDDLLAADAFEDYGPNGLQVPGAAEVELVVSGVSAHLELFAAAARERAQLVLCHHGIFWGEPLGPLSAALKARLAALFDADLSLAAYHLPLDAHPEHGNNALLCSQLGLERGEPFGAVRGRPIGFVGRARDEIPAGDFLERVRATTRREPLVLGAGPEAIRSVGIVSGAGASLLEQAVALGLDAFLTGEPAERVDAAAREASIHFIAAGHHATETLGVRRLGELVAERFGVEHRFVEVSNPV